MSRYSLFYSMRLLILLVCIFCPRIHAGSFDDSLKDSITWQALKRIKYDHCPEWVNSFAYRTSDVELGYLYKTGLRHHIRDDLSLRTILKRHEFKSEVGARNSLNEHSLGLSLMHHRNEHQLTFDFELGHHARPGGGVNWNYAMKPGAYVGLSLNRKSILESLKSLEYNEVEDRLSYLLSFQLPLQCFISAQGSYGYSHLYSKLRAHGKLSSHSINMGVLLFARSGFKMGQQFFEDTLLYNGEIRQYLQLAISQEIQRFWAGEGYLRQLDRTTKAHPTLGRVEFSWPISPRQGLRLNAGVGQDNSRKVDFGDLILFNAYYVLTPTHKFKTALAYRFSTENTGVVKGDISEVALHFHVNL
ncbi:MAG: hypothetical protein HQL32_02295 [Planctomycetes bacterium]|nr:hypothetical protein [Planctomycetota bacterium]